MNHQPVRTNYYSQSISELLSQLKTSKEGLSSPEAALRINIYGRNTLETHAHKTVLIVLISQLQNYLIIILIIASLLAYLLGQHIDSLVIMGVVFLTVLFGFFQEYRAEKTVAKLKKYLVHQAKVLRDGQWEEVDSSLLVPGDIISLRLGDRVPADLRLFEVDQIAIDESILTGESLAVTKQSQALSRENLLPQSQSNMAFEGTYVVAGMAKGVVVATGKKTQFGKTAAMLSEKSPATDFQKQIKNFSTFLSKIVLIMTIFVFGSNAILGKGILDSLLFAIALAVGIAPELLPMIITVTLSWGARKMAQKKVIVKKLVSVEDLGNIDTLCTDKTGTLTEGNFVLKSYQSLAGKENPDILFKALLCSSGFAHQGKTANQVDRALWQSPKSQDLKSKLAAVKLTDENEFDFERRMMSVVIEQNQQYLFLVKGAAESLLPLCNHYVIDGKNQLLTQSKSQTIINQVKQLDDAGYRTILIAEKAFQKKISTEADEKDLTLLGLLTFTDPVKKDVKKSLQTFFNLGVKVKILSGDSVGIVRKVALETGLINPEDQQAVITGEDLDQLNDQNFIQTIFENNLFARITPEHKKKIVAGLNKEGHIVGFLGDGVNDAPAIKASDVGIAVNTSSDVAKEAADIVLLTKDLSILAQGIEQGRKSFGNINKYIFNTISANYGNMFTVASSSLFLSFIPLLPKQILLNNFISDIPLLAIASDNVDVSFTKRPRRWNMKLIARFMLYFGFISSIFDFATILPLIFFWHASPALFQTAWFVESSLSEIIVTFAIRTQLPFYQSHPSKWLLGLSLISGLAVSVLPFLAFGRGLFSFVTLSLDVGAWIIVVLLSYFITVEFFKRYFFRKYSF